MSDENEAAELRHLNDAMRSIFERVIKQFAAQPVKPKTAIEATMLYYAIEPFIDKFNKQTLVSVTNDEDTHIEWRKLND